MAGKISRVVHIIIVEKDDHTGLKGIQEFEGELIGEVRTGKIMDMLVSVLETLDIVARVK